MNKKIRWSFWLFIIALTFINIVNCHHRFIVIKALSQLCWHQLHEFWFTIPVYHGPNPRIGCTSYISLVVSTSIHVHFGLPIFLEWPSTYIDKLFSHKSHCWPTLNMSKPSQTSLLIYHLQIVTLNAIEHAHF